MRIHPVSSAPCHVAPSRFRGLHFWNWKILVEEVGIMGLGCKAKDTLLMSARV